MMIIKSLAAGGMALIMLAATPVAAQNGHHGRDRNDNRRDVAVGVAVGALAGAALATNYNRDRRSGSPNGYYDTRYGSPNGYYDNRQGYGYSRGNGYYVDDRERHYRQDRRAHRRHDREHRREERRHDRQHERRW